MDLGDIVPVFQLVFFFVLPSLILLVFFTLLYKLSKKFMVRLQNFKNEIAKANLEQQLHNNMPAKENRIAKGFHMVMDFVFADALVAIIIIFPMLLMVLMFISSNSYFMLQHFWDYAYPGLAGIMGITSVKIISDLLYRITQLKGVKG